MTRRLAAQGPAAASGEAGGVADCADRVDAAARVDRAGRVGAASCAGCVDTAARADHADRAGLAARRMSELGREFAACRDVFTALGDESRQLIFMQLLQHYGGMRVGELTGMVGLSRPTVSHHLKILKEAGLVNMYSVGTKNFYHASSNLAKWREIARLAKQAERFVEEWLECCDQGMTPPYRME